uniref:Uncharacterized protein n=1 Tax=Oryza barthii TaxID=65489 RepID=A0A0D3FIT0_9ORYZ
RRVRPAAALLLQLLRAPVHHARLLQQLPARGGRLRRRPQGLRRRRHAPRPPAPARRRQAARHRRPPGPPGVAGGGDLLGAVPAPAPGEAAGLLLRGRGAPPRLRVHAARQPREPPLQEDIGDGAVGHASEDRHRRRQGPRLPPRRLHPRHLPRLQGLQHPPRLGVHGEAVGLRAGEDGAGGFGDARDDAGDGHARVRGAGVRDDGAPQHQERRVQLRRRAPGAPDGAARHGARQGEEPPRRPGLQGHGRHRRPLAHQRPRRRQERHLRQDPRRGQRRRLRRRRGLAAAERLRQAALIARVRSWARHVIASTYLYTCTCVYIL